MTHYLLLVLTPVGGGDRLHSSTRGPFASLERAHECAEMHRPSQVCIIRVEYDKSTIDEGTGGGAMAVSIINHLGDTE